METKKYKDSIIHLRVIIKEILFNIIEWLETEKKAKTELKN